MNCETCPTGQYKDNDKSHKTCKQCDAPGKVATQSQRKCELCPSVSISLQFTCYLPSCQYPPLTNIIGSQLVYMHLSPKRLYNKKCILYSYLVYKL